jgi:TetR/AcrR family transcriptional regulator
LRGEFLEKFYKLTIDKQNIITDAALKCFGTNGYKKSSISDIAIGAGISKAMIFHYFGTKKKLYVYLMDLCSNILINEMEKFDNTVTDFFDRVMSLTNIKISVMKKHPEILSFLTSMYFEKDEEVKEDINANLKKGEDFRSKLNVYSMDESKFKDGIDPKFVMKMFGWLSEGYISQLPSLSGLNSEDLFKEFNEFNKCIDLFKNNFYK